jgi:hypothetical protein
MDSYIKYYYFISKYYDMMSDKKSGLQCDIKRKEQSNNTNLKLENRKKYSSKL